MTASQSLAELLDRLAALAPIRPPASDEAIAAAERRLGVWMSSDFRDAYARLNGTIEPTPVENGWFELWPLSRWSTVAECVQNCSEPNRNAFNSIGSAIVFADYSLESWHYAAHFSAASREPTSAIYLLHLRPYLVAASLQAFLAAALVDSPEIYPPAPT